jgi:ribonuclease P protein component
VNRIFHRNTLGKKEILRGKKASSEVFLHGEKIFQYPVLLYYRTTTYKRPSPLRVAFSVSKKRYKRAVDRNQIKRMMRESYRRLKHPLLHLAEKQHIGIDIMIIYVGKSKVAFDEFSESLLLSLKQLAETIEKQLS